MTSLTIHSDRVTSKFAFDGTRYSTVLPHEIPKVTVANYSGYLCSSGSAKVNPTVRCTVGDYSVSGASSFDLSHNFLDTLSGMRVVSNGENWHRAVKYLNLVAGTVYTITTVIRTPITGTFQIGFKFDSVDDNAVRGTVGNMIPIPNKPSILYITGERYLGDSLWEVRCEVTPANTGSYAVSVGPYSELTGTGVVDLLLLDVQSGGLASFPDVFDENTSYPADEPYVLLPRGSTNVSVDFLPYKVLLAGDSYVAGPYISTGAAHSSTKGLKSLVHQDGFDSVVTAIGGNSLADTLSKLPTVSSLADRYLVLWDGSANGFSDVNSYVNQVLSIRDIAGKGFTYVLPVVHVNSPVSFEEVQEIHDALSSHGVKVYNPNEYLIHKYGIENTHVNSDAFTDGVHLYTSVLDGLYEDFKINHLRPYRRNYSVRTTGGLTKWWPTDAVNEVVHSVNV